MSSTDPEKPTEQDRALFLKNLEEVRKSGDITNLMLELGDADIYCSDPHEILTYSRELEAMARANGEREWLLRALSSIADVTIKIAGSEGNWEAARRSAKEYFAEAKTAPPKIEDQGRAVLYLSNIEALTGNLEAAAAYLSEAEELLQRAGKEDEHPLNAETRALLILEAHLQIAKSEKDSQKTTFLEEKIAELRVCRDASLESWFRELRSTYSSKPSRGGFFGGIDLKTGLHCVLIIIGLIVYIYFQLKEL